MNLFSVRSLRECGLRTQASSGELVSFYYDLLPQCGQNLTLLLGYILGLWGHWNSKVESGKDVANGIRIVPNSKKSMEHNLCDQNGTFGGMKDLPLLHACHNTLGCSWILLIPLSLIFPVSGGNADLCWLLDCLDSLCSGLGVVCFWKARLHSHTALRGAHPPCQICSNVQSDHLPGHWLQICLLPDWWFESNEEEVFGRL